MTTPKRMVQAYRQAPWRIQTQRGVLFLIVAILGASVLWVMVSVTVQAAAAGLEIQKLEDQQDELQRQIAGLKTEYAALTSADQMRKRATDMGFRSTDPKDITYLVVPGYQGRQPEIQSISASATVHQPLIKPAYTQSLWEWLLQGFVQISEQPGGLSP